MRKAFPNLYVQSLHDMTEKYKELIHTMSPDDEPIFHAELAQQWQWKAGERGFLALLDERPHAVRELLNQTAVPPGKGTTFAWLHFWHALSAQLARLEGKIPLWDASSTEEGHPAPCPVGTNTIRLAVISTLAAVKPQPALAIPSRRSANQNALSNPVPDAAGSSRDHLAGDPKVMATGHPGYTPGLQLLKPVREALSNLPSSQLLAKPVQNKDYTFQEKTKALLHITNQVAETCKKAEDTDASEMARTLYMYMADIPSATPMLPLLLKATTGSQISNLLAVNTPNFATDNTMVIERLQQWQSWYVTNEAGRVASEAAKIACLEALHEKFNGMDHNALDWGHVGTTLAIKLPISFDLKMTLTQADTKEKLWVGILAAVIETELKEDLETITKTCSQMKVTSAFPA